MCGNCIPQPFRSGYHRRRIQQSRAEEWNSRIRQSYVGTTQRGRESVWRGLLGCYVSQYRRKADRCIEGCHEYAKTGSGRNGRESSSPGSIPPPASAQYVFPIRRNTPNSHLEWYKKRISESTRLQDRRKNQRTYQRGRQVDPCSPTGENAFRIQWESCLPFLFNLTRTLASVKVVEMGLKPRLSSVVFFVGQKDVLDSLLSAHIKDSPLRSDGPAISALAGLGGSGKTQISLKFALDYEERYVSRSILVCFYLYPAHIPNHQYTLWTEHRRLSSREILRPSFDLRSQRKMVPCMSKDVGVIIALRHGMYRLLLRHETYA
jgi:hypothetical protein